ncbi:DUF2721 domain-containing protein [Marinilabiliaceae bacterium ANBcel2]|nr:DUF2721 domain-containing protein [Marinilabiliaceae bacterium ANBcel2]
MEQLTLSTPALLFSAISLIMLAYTNRFLAYAALVRSLHEKFKDNPDKKTYEQIKNMRKRLVLTRLMQITGISSLLLCVVCMFLIYIKWTLFAAIVFAVALLFLIFSLGVSIREILISVKALNWHLSDMEEY